MARARCGCIDIGSNTTRLLVAEAGDDALAVIVSERSFTRIGASREADGRIPAVTIEHVARVAAGQARRAREHGAGELVAVATAAIRDAPNRDELVAAVERSLGVELWVLSGEEEARLAFLGATRALGGAGSGRVAVVDVGGGSTELAIGSPDGDVAWWASLAVGSSVLAGAHLRSDPPAASELEQARAQVAKAFDGLDPPPAASAVAVGGTATSLHRLVGPDLNAATLGHGLELLCEAPAKATAERFDLDPERVRLLPAGMVVLEAVCAHLRLALRVVRGGLREGVVLERLAGHRAGGA
jgi:exopolyphosphatase/guanosine-5'-triphosphate,3'-diphosphate pyrophosphatase